MSTTAGPVLEFEDVHLSFGAVKAVNGVSFSVAENELFAVIGPNGAGKTSIFNVLSGVYRPQQGRVTLHGTSLLGMRPPAIARLGMARTFQNIELFANLTVSRSSNAKGAVFFDVQPLPELAELREAVYVGGKKVVSEDYLKQLTPLALAIWYMDDANFTLRSEGKQARTADGTGRAEICVEAMSPDSRVRLRDHLADTWGIHAVLSLRGARNFEQQNDDGHYSRIERVSGRFARTFTLPENVATDQINAKFKDGVLELTIPKAAKPEPRRIEVQAA